LKGVEAEAAHCTACTGTLPSSPAADVIRTVKEKPYIRAVAISLLRGAIVKLVQVIVVSVCSWTQ
jgi:hypothetical protein